MESIIRKEAKIIEYVMRILCVALVITMCFIIWLDFKSSHAAAPQGDNICQRPLRALSTIQTPSGLWSPVCVDPATQTIYLNGQVSIGPNNIGGYTARTK